MIQQLLEIAREKHGPDIIPCSGRRSFEECVSRYGKKAILWFNTQDDSTHTVTIEVRETDHAAG